MITGLAKLAQLQPWTQSAVRSAFAALADAGISGAIWDVYRSPQEQDRRFRLGDTLARGGQSPHQYGLAFDFVVSQGEQSPLQLAVQRWWQDVGYGIVSWDHPHVEIFDWRRYR